MRTRMVLQKAILLYLAYFMLLYQCSPAFADPVIEQSSKLLEKGLSVFELDKEINRLTDKERQVAVQVKDSEINIGKQEVLVQQQRIHAGRVLRAYYTGDRDSIWLLLFSMKSFTDLLVVYDFLNTLIQNDHKLLDNYVASFRQLKLLNEQLVETQNKLHQLTDKFIAERDRKVEIQKELDAQLAKQPELKKQIEDLTKQWETVGVPLFENYMTSLSSAMKGAQVLFTPDHLTVGKDDSIFTITDAELNTYLRSKNDIFKNFSFVFDKDAITASTKQAGIEATLVGIYVLEEKPENHIQFRIKELIFNGNHLPDTTGQHLEELHDLSFYPQRIASFIVATGVSIEPGKMLLRIKIKA